MSKSLIEILPKNFSVLSEYKREKCFEVFAFLENNEKVYGVLLGGSMSYKEDIEKSDIDIFCLINQVENLENDLKYNIQCLTDVDTIIYQGFFPWTEKLYTIYYKHEIDFSIDICLIDQNNAETFFWEPQGCLLFDKDGIIERSRNNQMSKPTYTKQPLLKTNPFTMAVISIKKIEKNIYRGHLWNALDQVRNLRKYLMQVVRLYVIKNSDFLGRVDREIEDILPNEINRKFSDTVAIYKKTDIVLKTIALSIIAESLIEFINGTEEEYLKDWVLKHLINEREKLSKYIQ